MPIRIVVLRGNGRAVHSQLSQVTGVSDRRQDATQFVFNDRNVVVPEPTAADIQVFAGLRRGAAAEEEAGPGAEG